MDTITRCNLCNSQRSIEMASSAGKWRLVKCSECDSVYLNPRPSFSELDIYYPTPTDYDRHWVLENYLKENNNLTKRFYRGLAGAYSSSQTSRLRRFLFSFLKDHIGGLPRYRKQGRILDVGCADGFFLYLMKELGWQTTGIETNKQAAMRAQKKGLEVSNSLLSEANLPADHFDVVRLWHVLEHTNDPSQTLTEIRRILKPNGELILGVPNLDSLTLKIFRDYNKWQKVWNLPLHLFFYSRKTLRKLLTKCGFKNISIGTHSGGAMRMALEQLLNVSTDRYGKFRKLLLGLPFLFSDFLVNRTIWSDCLESRCRK